MPHTNNRKRPQVNKRREILDDDGWTRVTSGPTPALSGRVGHAADRALEPRIPEGQLTDGLESTSSYAKPQAPAEIMTLDKLQKAYHSTEARWEKSDSCKALKQILKDRNLSGLPRLTNCVLFGTGSPSGLTAGWIQRHEVALYQIAAFRSVVETIEQIQGQRPPAFAQEPCYNSLDEELLVSLGISKVDHPEGFDLLTSTSFVYCPGAELFVTLQTLKHNPVLYLGSSVDLYRGPHRHEHSNEGKAPESRDSSRDICVIDIYEKDKEGMSLPDLEARDHPFHQQHLYWRPPTGQEQESA